jgi:transposase
MMQGLFGLPMSLGAVSGLEEEASGALAPGWAEAHAQAQRERVKNADETSWREGRVRTWLWTVVTASVTVFVVSLRRNTEQAKALLGAVLGVLGTDRHGAYTFWPTTQRQLCWAHLTRDLVAIVERGGPAAEVATKLLEEKDRMFAWWHRVRDGTLRRSTFRGYMRVLIRRVDALLDEAIAPTMGPARSRKVLVRLSNLREGLFTFVRAPGVEPTNNAAERAVRPAVLWRRMSQGTKSAAGSRFVERILTVHATCKQQGRSVVDFVEAACRAKRAGAPAPSLLTTSEPTAIELPEAA